MVWIDNAENYSLVFVDDLGAGFLTYGPLHHDERKGL
jgi:hypothetical protein